MPDSSLSGYTKIDTPRLNVSNACVVYIVGNAPVAYVEPSISAKTAILTASINGKSSYTDTNTGLTVNVWTTYGSGINFTYEYTPPDNPVTGSSVFKLEVETTGGTTSSGDTYSGDVATFYLGLVCCTKALDIHHAGNNTINVSGLEHTISAGKDFTPIKDILGSSSVMFKADADTFTGVPDTPGAFIGVVAGSHEPVEGLSAPTKRPINIAIVDTRKYTDQDYVIATANPGTITVDRTAIKIHDVFSTTGGVGDDKLGPSAPFDENPGNGFFLSCGTSGSSVSYKDANSDSHIYTINRTSAGTDNNEEPSSHCPYYKGGSCTYSPEGCYYGNTGIRTITDSKWELRHNNSIIAEASSVYNSDIPPSSGWSSAVITGEAEIQYEDPNTGSISVYAYSSSYMSVVYCKYNDGGNMLCLQDTPHLLHYYKEKKNYSKSLKGWGTYGGPANPPTTSVSTITYDTVTGKYAQGIKTISITDNTPGVLEGVGPLTGAALVVHPVTGQYMDFVLALAESSSATTAYGVGSGFGSDTAGGGYGVATRDPLLPAPALDWAPFYSYRPRQTSMLPYTTNHSISVGSNNYDLGKYVFRLYSIYSATYTRGAGGTFTEEAGGMYFEEDPGGIYAEEDPYIYAKKLCTPNIQGLITSSRKRRTNHVMCTVVLDSSSVSLPFYEVSLDNPSVFYNVNNTGVQLECASAGHKEQVTVDTEYGAYKTSPYILYDGILYAGTDVFHNILCPGGEDPHPCVPDPENSMRCRRLLASWGAVVHDYMKWIKVTGTSGTTRTKANLTEEDIKSFDPSGSGTVYSVYTGATISAYTVHKVSASQGDYVGESEPPFKTYSILYVLTLPGDGSYSLTAEEASTILPKGECDLIKTYGAEVEQTWSSTEKVTKSDNGFSYYDPNIGECYHGSTEDWCEFACSMDCSGSAEFSMKKAFTINAITGTLTPYEESTSSGHTYLWAMSHDICDCTDLMDDGLERKSTMTKVSSAMTIRTPDTSRILQERSSSCSNGPFVVSDTVSHEITDTIAPYILPVFTVSGNIEDFADDGSYNHSYTLSTRINLIETVGTFGYSGCRRSFYELPGYSYTDTIDASHKHLYSDKVTLELKTTTTNTVTSTPFAFIPDGDLGLYIPTNKSIQYSQSADATYEEVHYQASESATGKSTKTLSTTITLTEVTTSDSSCEDVPESPICYVSGGPFHHYKTEASLSGVSYSTPLGAPTSYCLFPYEAPSSGSYRSIVASSRVHIIPDIVTDSTDPSRYTNIREYGYERCEGIRYAPTSDEFLCPDMPDSSSSYGEAVDVSDSLSMLINIMNDISIVSKNAHHIPLSDINSGISIRMDISDSSLSASTSGDNYYVDKNVARWAHLVHSRNMCLDHNGDMESRKLTIAWTTRPKFTQEDNEGPPYGIILPIISESDSGIYMSQYSQKGPLGSCETKFVKKDCNISSVADIDVLFSRFMGDVEADLSDASYSGSSEKDGCMCQTSVKLWMRVLYIDPYSDALKLREDIKRALGGGPGILCPSSRDTTDGTYVRIARKR